MWRAGRIFLTVQQVRKQPGSRQQHKTEREQQRQRRIVRQAQHWKLKAREDDQRE
jgi:hypothetical protein